MRSLKGKLKFRKSDAGKRDQEESFDATDTEREMKKYRSKTRGKSKFRKLKKYRSDTVETWLDYFLGRSHQNILYICANDKTFKSKEGEKYLEDYLTDSRTNYYIGLDDFTHDLSKNKCKVAFGVNDISICNFNVLFDFIVLEYCPIFMLQKSAFDGIKKLLKPNGVLVVPGHKNVNTHGLKLIGSREVKHYPQVLRNITTPSLRRPGMVYTRNKYDRVIVYYYMLN